MTTFVLVLALLLAFANGANDNSKGVVTQPVAAAVAAATAAALRTLLPD